MKKNLRALLIPAVLAQSLVPASAQAIEGIDRVRILEITAIHTDTAFSDAAVFTAVVAGLAVSVAAAAATGGLSIVAESEVAAGVAATTIAVGGVEVAVAGSTAVTFVAGSAGAYGAYKVTTGGGSADNLIAEFASGMNVSNFHYIQNTHGSKTPHDMKKGYFVRPPENTGLNVVPWPASETDHSVAFLQLYERDTLANDDLGQLTIHSYNYMSTNHPDLIFVDPVTKIETYVDVKHVVPPKDSEDDSVYLVKYSVEKNGGTCHGLSPVEKKLHEKWYSNATHSC